jgi:hypothetical protein
MKHATGVLIVLGLALLISLAPWGPWSISGPAAQAQGAARASATSTATSMPTAFPIRCTAPACATDEQLHCPDTCPGGCGYTCIPVPSSEPTPVPEPTTLVLLGIAAGGLAAYVAFQVGTRRRTGAS